MKKPLLIVLACLLCFFAGYFAGIKSKPVSKGINAPYRMRQLPKRIIMPNRIPPRIPKNIPSVNKLPNKPATVPAAASKTKSTVQTAKTASATNTAAKTK